VERTWEKWNVYRLLVGKPEGKKSLGRQDMWVDNIKRDRVEIAWSGVNWFVLAEDRHKCRTLVNAVMNIRVP
jgi:hypothetical protein